MRRKLAGSLLACALCAAAASAAAGPRAAVAPSQARATIEGTWSHNYVLVFESPAKWPALVVSEHDAPAVAAIEAKQISDFFAQGLDPEVPALMTQIDGLPLVRGQRRTRILVDPADGKLPYRPEILKAMHGPPPPESFDNPEDRPAPERCLTGVGQPPLVSLTFAIVLQIVRTKAAVAIHTEYGDEVRVVPITDTHGPRTSYSRMGDSIGHWEGDTLVVETIGLPDDDSFRIGPIFIVSGAAKVTERFTAVSDKELLYQFTVDDPKTYTAPWRGEFSWYRTDKLMYEHACHEGNYSLPNILAGARHEEATAKAAAAAGK
ncbi:hypothetical protein [Phenylobacterium sp.]|jgi:hypothetical protein|uniref:hypothetical protein n=1 Tax=Phenylobacterium sp. TaxID=1871053 RepID=UPI002F427CBE